MRPGNYMGDTNFSEQFLKFIMCKRSQTNSGVDLAPYSPDKLSETKKLLGSIGADAGWVLFPPSMMLSKGL